MPGKFASATNSVATRLKTFWTGSAARLKNGPSQRARCKGCIDSNTLAVQTHTL
jgi:hypothetical protein